MSTATLPAPTISHAALIARMRAIVGPDNVLTSAADMAAYECDGFTIAKTKPDVVVFPTSTEHIVGIVKACEDPNERLEKYVEACRAVAKERKVPLVDHNQHWKDPEAKGTAIRDWTTDGCHPNPQGHRELADLIEPILKKALK